MVTDAGQPWWEHEPVPDRRKALPETKAKLPCVQELWTLVKAVLRNSNSFDLPVPVHMCLPIDELQRKAEELEYSELLDQAAQKPKGSVERLLLVAAFAVSAFQSVAKLKASNPMMGETVELVLPEKRMRVLVETTYINRGENRVIDSWVAEGECEPTLKARGATIELRLNWLDCLTFSDGDAFHWTKLTTGVTVINIIKMTTTYKGTMVVHNPGSGLSAHMEFKDGSASMLGALMTSGSNASQHQASTMVGHIEQDGVLLPKLTISGAWDAALVADMPDGSAWTILSMHPPPPQANRYGLNLFSMQLGEMIPGLEARLPPSDVRRRWDLAALEQGRTAEAAAGKALLEARWHAREAAHCAASGETSLRPRWFELRSADALSRPRGHVPRFRYKGGYWESRAEGKWEDVEDMFTPEI